MKILLALGIVFLAACDSGYQSAPPNVQLGADVITANQTAQAASARSNALSAQATAARQATEDVSRLRATDAAIQLQFLHVTETAAAAGTSAAIIQKTEDAHDNEVVRSHIATYTAQTPTAAAIQTQTRIAEGERTATVAALETKTRAAEDAATATRLAERPTQTAIAVAAIADQDRREQARQLELRRAAAEQDMAPLAAFIQQFTPPVAVAVLISIFLIGLWGIMQRIQGWIDARTELVQTQALTAQSASLSQVIVKDRFGNLIGYFQFVNAQPQFQPFDVIDQDDDDDASVTPPLLTTGSMKDRMKEIEPPKENPVEGLLIYPSELQQFTAGIIEKGWDWSQPTWRDETLRRGYVLSMDSKDANRDPVIGGYRKLIKYYVDRNLIINRRGGKSGDWNPNAPQDVEGIMKILLNEASLPAVQVAEQALPSPTRSRRRRMPAIS